MSDRPKFRQRGAAALTQAPASILPAAPAPNLILPDSLRARFSAPRKPGFKASPQQLAYFDWLEKGSGNLILEAVAGAGKSTTLLKGLRYMKGFTFLGAYNKAAAQDLKNKATAGDDMQKGVHISTLHAFGMYDWRKLYPQVEVDDQKTYKLIDRFVATNPAEKDAKIYRAFINKMVSFGKQFLIGCEDKPPIENLSVWLKLVDHFGTDTDLPENMPIEQALAWVIEVYTLSHLECRTRIDFDDMIYAPLAYNIRLFQNDWVLIDECQDINPARREMAKRAMKRNGRAVFVGDSRQAIYGFTGAGGDSIQRIVEEFKCERLPLTVTYRCPKAVVNYVHQWVSHIEAHPDAPEGVVRPVKFDALGQACLECEGEGHHMIQGEFPAPCRTCKGARRSPVEPWFIQDAPTAEDVIICRFTRPLIQTAYQMINKGIACKVEGRDIGRGLTSICKLWKISTITKLEERLKIWAEREIAKAIKAGSEKKQQEVEDKRDSLAIFIARCRTQGKTLISELIDEIEAMFADDVEGMVTLCTGHKSKGREWPRVYWIRTADRRCSREWEAQEEENVKYVIGTRAQRELILVPDLTAKVK